VTTEFEKLGRAQATALAHPGLPIIVIPHPLGIRTRMQLREIAEAYIDDIARAIGAK
jgi:hypothetical protein